MAKNSSDELRELFLKHPRKFGAFYTFIGIGFLFWMIVLPIQQATAGATNISISGKGMLLGEICLLFGLMLLIFGSRSAQILSLGNEQPKNPAYYITIAVIVFMGIGTDNVMKTFLTSKGYILS
jgi:hypothetical protein